MRGENENKKDPSLVFVLVQVCVCVSAHLHLHEHMCVLARYLHFTLAELRSEKNHQKSQHVFCCCYESNCLI